MAQVEAVSFGTELKVCSFSRLSGRNLELTYALGWLQARG